MTESPNRSSYYQGAEEQENEAPDPENEQDFRKAYDKLVQKYYNEHGANMLIPEEDYQRVDQQKIDVKELQKRIETDLQRKEQKLQAMRE